ncbi:MAG: hypothetical protein KGJ78_02525 [Alphaproteobacteria bacterium]|nr:hypothetical protein [Alphaproteobacteria bacterium]
MRTALLAALFLAGAAQAAPEEMDYSKCVSLVDRNPALAEERAHQWQQAGGGRAAIHCDALALTALKHYAEAAHELDALARERGISLPEQAALYDQAGNAWLLAGKGAEALADFSASLAAKPDPAVIVDRARARAMLKDWKGAEADLSTVLHDDQNRADLLVLRASARWALGRRDDAATDILRALQIYPDYPPALVERGMMKLSIGDKNGARSDWKKAAASGDSGAAEDARQNLTALDAQGRTGR